MELSQLRAFVAVSRTGTVAAAADILHVTASPLSRTVRELERQLGRDLFTRAYHRFTLTEFGRRLLPLAVEMIAQADECELLAFESSPMLRSGATPWTSRALSSRFQQALARSGEPLGEFSSALSSVLLHDLRHGITDIALVHLPVDEPGIETIALARYNYSIAAAGDSSLDLGRPVRLTDLRGRSLLSLPMMMQPKPMKSMLDRLYEAGVASIVEVDLRDMIDLQNRMARTGELMLTTISPDLPSTRFLDQESMQIFPLAEGEILFEVGLAWRTRDSVHGARLAAVVDELRPVGGLELIG
ncbi:MULTISPECIES: LysR family transcriptional regulator [unclassified Microbacterium]|uniref:LysR family transcriptional regulator n=1 Tax=unclassified Microbacterium TaxID=2609290 RepID=UPI001604F3D4|nr:MULTISPECIES: LysR family transcriptional regulator [unclassified Microbacterium]QNA91847.1 LysR family transcriptional regulator [Microbacterium sp. Se63.02b]QYM65064.1 LysR family transcriptional regulator [Microbacterium sp. Se5.02b]